MTTDTAVRSEFSTSLPAVIRVVSYLRVSTGRQAESDLSIPDQRRQIERYGYAADLLMPYYLFKPLARQQGKLTFKAVNALADIFKTSRPATAIRLVESDHSPALLVCHGPKGRKWFTRAPSVPQKWFPQEFLHAESFAFGIQFGGNQDDSIPRKIGADAWFDRRDADRFEVQEQTMRSGPDETLTLILINDSTMLEEQDKRRSWMR